MQSTGVLIDTSVLIDFLKGRQQHLQTIIEEQRGHITGVIIAELLQGVKNPREEDTIATLLEGLQLLEITNDVWLKAGKLSSFLRRKGISLPITDIALATLSIEHDLSVLTLDKHFEQIPGVSLYKTS